MQAKPFGRLRDEHHVRGDLGGARATRYLPASRPPRFSRPSCAQTVVYLKGTEPGEFVERAVTLGAASEQQVQVVARRSPATRSPSRAEPVDVRFTPASGEIAFHVWNGHVAGKRRRPLSIVERTLARLKVTTGSDGRPAVPRRGARATRP